ncbi:DUF3368 domain-containing protein [uncultured Methylobacterium sp.]|uniref:DUF3368 domain-containing protein n=1 Tax=uncultured Methylobacterium sp. TaxID=157278 RepID=UPI0035C9C40A
MFGIVMVPEAVRDELDQPETPAVVRAWLESRPAWLTIRPGVPCEVDPALEKLDVGEREAIRLAIASSADLILMDDRAGAAAAREREFKVIGTLGVIDLAGRKGLLDVRMAIRCLQATNFRCRPELLQDLLVRHRGS